MPSAAWSALQAPRCGLRVRVQAARAVAEAATARLRKLTARSALRLVVRLLRRLAREIDEQLAAQDKDP